MGRFFDCQMAIVHWGAKATFRRARVGLLRRGSLVYIAVFVNSNNNYKFLIDDLVEILPAAIRFRELQKDLFIRQVSDEQKHSTMMREIKIIQQRDKLRQGGKAAAFEKFIHSITPIDLLDSKDLTPTRVSARLVGSTVPKSTSAAKTCDDGRMVVEYNNNYSKRPNYQDSSDVTGLQLRNKQLKRIKICRLEELPKQLWLRASLHELTLTECNLTCVPKQLEAFSKTLTFLDLSHNRINNLPRAFCCKMNDLKFLDLSHNLIETLPIEIKFFRRLVNLNISKNRLRRLPSTFSDLRSLRHLNVASNNLSQLPAFRNEDIRLRELDVSHNPLDGASHEANTFEVYPSIDDSLAYNENLVDCRLTTIQSKYKFPTLFEISMLKVVRCDRLLKVASEESLPATIVSTMQRDIFKCYRCRRMNILPAYNFTDILDYVDQVDVLKSTGNYRHGMTFMRLLCRFCFDNMSC